MISEKQRKANRENAKKSTGPRTAEGKARSSKNGIKHGLLARDAVMADEDQAEYDRSFQELEENLFPKNNIEFRLVRQIADADWRLLRLTRIEAGLIMQAYNSTSRFDRKHYPDSILPGRDGENQLLGKGMQDHMPSLATLARYRTQANRDMMRCLKMIRQLRADEAACGENLSWNGATHRPIPTDPDPYNTPDPMQPQPERYEPPAEPAETAQTSDPIGFRANTPSATSGRPKYESRSRITIHGSRVTNHA